MATLPLPAAARKKFGASLRTGYTVLLCIILVHYWNFAGNATYIAPTISAISAAAAYFGALQNDLLKFSYGTVVGGGLGVAIGFAWGFMPLQMLLSFCALVWITLDTKITLQFKNQWYTHPHDDHRTNY